MKTALARAARPFVFASLALVTWALPAPAAPDPARDAADYEAYRKVVRDTTRMVHDADARRLAAGHGLSIVDLTWEDTGRWKNSALGPNISDMTIQVQQMDPRNEQFHLSCMPVIRFPNFADKTGDVDPAKFFLVVGNEKGAPLRRISLAELLKDPTAYLNRPAAWKAPVRSLWNAERDTHVLVSAQACFLPIPRHGDATFNPVLFNYQSYAGDPAVLTILATREGTSITVIDNQRDAFQAGPTWGQRLFFNQAGRRASLTGKRLSDFVGPPADAPTPTVEAARQRGLNLVLLIQVPLKQRGRRPPPPPTSPMPAPPPTASAKSAGGGGSDVEEAVVGHGAVEGPFTEIDDLAIRRDPDYPVRVTVQFYKATSNGVVSEGDLADIATQIRRVYEEADYVGSLVTEGDTGRPTESGTVTAALDVEGLTPNALGAYAYDDGVTFDAERTGGVVTLRFRRESRVLATLTAPAGVATRVADDLERAAASRAAPSPGEPAAMSLSIYIDGMRIHGPNVRHIEGASLETLDHYAGLDAKGGTIDDPRALLIVKSGGRWPLVVRLNPKAARAIAAALRT